MLIRILLDTHSDHSLRYTTQQGCAWAHAQQPPQHVTQWPLQYFCGTCVTTRSSFWKLTALKGGGQCSLWGCPNIHSSWIRADLIRFRCTSVIHNINYTEEKMQPTFVWCFVSINFTTINLCSSPLCVSYETYGSFHTNLKQNLKHSHTDLWVFHVFNVCL